MIGAELWLSESIRDVAKREEHSCGLVRETDMGPNERSRVEDY
jgi:hypothetical protein